MVPAVDCEVVVASDGDDSWLRHHRMCVGGHVRDGRVGEELHDHADVVLHRAEHLRRLRAERQDKKRC